MNGNTAIKHKVCSHCGDILHTKREYEEGQCETCQEAYEEEMVEIYGDDWHT